jgi:hypothetical protein
VAKDCAKNDTMRGNNMNITICYNCGKNDHTAKDCKKKKKLNSGIFLKFSLRNLFFLWRRGTYCKRMPQKRKGSLFERRRLLPVWFSETYQEGMSRTARKCQIKQILTFYIKEEKRRYSSGRRTRFLILFN